MIIRQFYINTNVELALEITGLSLDELEQVVKRYKKHSFRAGLLRGEVLELVDGCIKIRHAFTKKVLWTN
jgi:hypothetical protein